MFLDYGCIIRDNVTIKADSVIGANCSVGGYMADWYKMRLSETRPTVIGEKSIVRSGSIIYSEVTTGKEFQKGLIA